MTWKSIDEIEVLKSVADGTYVARILCMGITAYGSDYDEAVTRALRMRHAAENASNPMLAKGYVTCAGYWGPVFSGGQGEQKRLLQSCPELDRRQGHRPGTGKGYPESWDRRCTACGNTGWTTQKAIDDRKVRAGGELQCMDELEPLRCGPGCGHSKV